MMEPLVSIPEILLGPEIMFLDQIILLLMSTGVIYCFALASFRIATFETENLLDIAFICSEVIITAFIVLYFNKNVITARYSPEVVYNTLSYAGIIFEVYLIRYIYTDIMGGRKFRYIDLTGKVYIVTGSNAGIGYETAKELVRMGATVVLACRSVEKAKLAKDRISKETRSNKEFKTMGLPLHGLINNAGVMMDERSLTQDGFEIVFTANHLSHFLLTTLLLPELEKTGGRIVNLTSSLYKMTKAFDFNNYMSDKSYSLFGTYSQSKLANILFTVELQRRLTKKGSKVTCNAVHPGAVRTEVTRHMNVFMRTLNSIFAPLLYPIQKTPQQGAYCSIFVATDPALDSIGGKLFIDSKYYPLASSATDPIAAEKLWELSETLTGLKK